MIVTPTDVRELLASREDNPTLVVLKGTAQVVSDADLRRDDDPGRIVVASRDDLRRLVENLDLDDPSERDLQELAGRLSTAVDELGG